MEKKNHFLKYKVEKADHGKQVLAILREKLFLTTRKIRSIKQEAEGILLDGKRVTVRQCVEEGQTLAIMLNDAVVEDNIVPWDVPLDIVYEDQDLLFVNKPAGIVSHPSLGHKYDSLANIVKAYFLAKEENSGIHLIGRLDKDTSGILGIAKNGVTKDRMIEMRKEGLIKKEYLALVKGQLEKKEGCVQYPMEEYRDADFDNKLRMRLPQDGNQGLYAITHYKVVEEYEESSLVRLWLDTGRMHQIRFHMACLGHPLLGDSLYGEIEENMFINRSALHAYQVTFQHPYDNKLIRLQVDLPEDMRITEKG